MMTSNHQTLSKQVAVRKLQFIKTDKCDVWDLTSNKDIKELFNELEKLIRKGSLSIIVIKGDQR